MLDPAGVGLLAVGVVAGIFVGAMPGLTVTMAVALLITLTYGWSLPQALALIMGVFVGGVYGGSRAAVLLNIPGAPAAIATGFDGYPMARRGEAGLAIGLATAGSVVGGLLGMAALVTVAPWLSAFALGFGPQEYFVLALFGMTVVSALSPGSLHKGLLSLLIGVLLSTVGMDPVYGVPRFTFGRTDLLVGVSFIPVMIGLFGMGEVFYQMGRRARGSVATVPIERVRPSWRELARHGWLTLRAAAIGIFIGALPGTGGDVASLMAYGHARQTTPRPTRPFGEGAHEGVIAPETANNAAIGGALIPLLTLGIPGDAVTAVILGGLALHNVRAGPLLMMEHPDIFRDVALGGILGHLILLVVGFVGIRPFVRITTIPRAWLMPVVAVLAVVGTYAVDNNAFQVVQMMGFGVLGYVMKLYRVPAGPLVLGVIPGPLAESNFRRAVLLSGGPMALLRDLVTHPISAVLLVAMVATVAVQTLVPLLRRRPNAAVKQAARGMA